MFMGFFEANNNDLCLFMVKFKNLYLKELTYYGTSETNKMFDLINISQEISRLENILVEDYYNKFVKEFLSNNNDDIKHDINLYNIQKILFETFDILNSMVILWILNTKDNEEFDFKSRYLVGSIENFIEKILNPIMPKLNMIVFTNKIFKNEVDLLYLTKFISINKNKFNSKEQLKKIELFIKLQS
jgi:hypothetical protein